MHQLFTTSKSHDHESTSSWPKWLVINVQNTGPCLSSYWTWASSLGIPWEQVFQSLLPVNVSMTLNEQNWNETHAVVSGLRLLFPRLSSSTFHLALGQRVVELPRLPLTETLRIWKQPEIHAGCTGKDCPIQSTVEFDPNPGPLKGPPRSSPFQPKGWPWPNTRNQSRVKTKSKNNEWKKLHFVKQPVRSCLLGRYSGCGKGRAPWPCACPPDLNHISSVCQSQQQLKTRNKDLNIIYLLISPACWSCIYFQWLCLHRGSFRRGLQGQELITIWHWNPNAESHVCLVPNWYRFFKGSVTPDALTWHDRNDKLRLWSRINNK